MSSKQLTATVRLNANQAEKTINSLINKINRLDSVVNKVGKKDILSKQVESTSKKVDNLNKKIEQIPNHFNKVDSKLSSIKTKVVGVGNSFSRWVKHCPIIGNRLTSVANKLRNISSKILSVIQESTTWSKITNRISPIYSTATSKLATINTKIREWFNNQNKVNSATNKTTSALGSIWTKLKGIAAAYVGIMGTRAVIQTSDAITSAENKLNYQNGGDIKSTQATMDKVYAASQRARTDSMKMLNNVSKTMILAGDSFQNNVDNAVKFQEIMSKAYAISGASAEEQSSSMYQLVQALGSGILQGDELRSVREGAALAYKEIEKFAQEVLNTDESLKDLASQGLITSDIVVSAIMNAEDKINQAFEGTEKTFAQAATSIKNMAIQAFMPVLQKLNDILNSDTGEAIVNGIGKSFIILGEIAVWLIDVFGKCFNLIAENWYWIQWIVLSAVICLIMYFTILVAKAIWTGIQLFISFMMGLSPIQLMILLIGVLVAFIIWLANTTVTGAEFMVYALLGVAAAILLIGIVTGSVVLIVVSLIVAVIAFLLWLFASFGEQIMSGIYVVGSFIANIFQLLGNIIATVLLVILAVIYNIIACVVNVIITAFSLIKTFVHNVFVFIGNLGLGLFNTMVAVATNIGIAFQNGWNAARSAFWEFIADCLDGVKSLEPIINAIAKAFGKSGFSLSGLASDLHSRANSYKQQDYVSVSNAWSSGFNTFERDNYTDAISSGMNAFKYQNLGNAASFGMKAFGTAFEDGWKDNASNKGATKGAEWQNKLNSFGSGLKDKISGFSIGDLWNSLSDGLGFNKEKVIAGKKPLLQAISDALNGGTGNGGGSGLIDPYDPAHALGGGFDLAGLNDDIANGINKLNGGVGDIGNDTGSIADSMELTEEDLEYLRKLADMEWKKEFTTANITVDMSNYNTLNSDSDLDGIVTKLSDKLYEELNLVASGVYV